MYMSQLCASLILNKEEELFPKIKNYKNNPNKKADDEEQEDEDEDVNYYARMRDVSDMRRTVEKIEGFCKELDELDETLQSMLNKPKEKKDEYEKEIAELIESKKRLEVLIPKLKTVVENFVPEDGKYYSDSDDYDPSIYEILDDEDRAEAYSDAKQLRSVAVAPNTAGKFTPFVYYTYLKECKFGPTVMEQQKSKKKKPRKKSHATNPLAYDFRSSENGWAPGFFNASFSWFYHARISTKYDKQSKLLTVALAETKEMVW